MKKLIFILLMLPLFCLSQTVSIFGGLTQDNHLLGVEVKTQGIGFYAEKYFSQHDYPNFVMPLGRNVYPEPEKILYDGIVVGINYNVKEYHNIIIGIGGGELKEYRVYNLNNNSSMQIKKTMAFELSMGKDYYLFDRLCLGAKIGMNTSTKLFGCVSIGLKL